MPRQRARMLRLGKQLSENDTCALPDCCAELRLAWMCVAASQQGNAVCMQGGRDYLSLIFYANYFFLVTAFTELSIAVSHWATSCSAGRDWP